MKETAEEDLGAGHPANDEEEDDSDNSTLPLESQVKKKQAKQ